MHSRNAVIQSFLHLSTSSLYWSRCSRSTCSTYPETLAPCSPILRNKRIASRIGTGLFNNVYGRNGSYVTAGQQDYAERMNQIQTQKEAYYKKVGVAPGVPTEKGAYGDPENTGVGYNSVLTELGNHDVPQGWIQTPHPNTTPGSNPGAPVSWNDPSNPDDPQAGYGYVPNDTTREETFFYHSDHLGSTSYITDDKANITQYDAYLPYGELLVDEHSSSEDLPYKFNGKQFDEETGLYYYGARYMNPVTSIWYGVDALTEKYPNVTRYCYTFNNPKKLLDPDGNSPIGAAVEGISAFVVSDGVDFFPTGFLRVWIIKQLLAMSVGELQLLMVFLRQLSPCLLMVQGQQKQ